MTCSTELSGTWLKVKVYVYSPDIPRRTADFTLITLGYWNSSFHSLISLGRLQCIFCSWIHSHNINVSFHLVPITAGWTEAVWIQSLPKAFLVISAAGIWNPRPFDLGNGVWVKALVSNWDVCVHHENRDHIKPTQSMPTLQSGECLLHYSTRLNICWNSVVPITLIVLDSIP